MSDNGPYGQPPHNPQEGDGTPGGGQPNFQSPYGTGPQQGPYPPGPPGMPPQGPPPGPPPPGPPQPMYGGAPGQPPYGPGQPPGPAGGAPGYPPPKKSNAGLYIVIGGGLVIVLLIVAVVVVLFRGGGEEPQAGGGGASPEASPSEEPSTEAGGGGGGGAQGEPPYALPDDPCAAFSEETMQKYELSDGSKSLTDSRSSCTLSAEGEGDLYGTVSVEYQVPYGGADSVEGAKTDFKDNLDYETDESSDIIPTEVHNQEEVNLGEEAVLVFSTQEIVGNQSVATVLVRDGNVNVKVQLMMSNGFDAPDDAPAPLKLEDVEDMMNDLGSESLGLLGA
ncbi:DUF3558 domain-containing protein [Nocardiopsis coralliicola]